MDNAPHPIGPTFEELTKAYDTLDFLAGLAEGEEWAREVTNVTPESLPLVIVTGGLGAGKTTLMQHLLTSPHGLAITAIVNDVANLNIDAALIKDATDDTIALANGCVCCSQSGGVARSLVDIGNRETTPDLVLLEASGVADPWALTQVAAAVPGVSLNCVVTIIDAAAPEPSDFLLQRQVAAADLLLLNKADLVTQQSAAHLTARMTELAPRAQILRTTECAIPFSLISDANSRKSNDAGIPEGVGVDGSTYRTATLWPRGPVDRKAVERCLETLPEGLLRIKGFLVLKDTPKERHLLQAVGRRWRWESAKPGSKTENGLAVIGLADVFQTAAVRSHFESAGLNWQDDAEFV